MAENFLTASPCITHSHPRLFHKTLCWSNTEKSHLLAWITKLESYKKIIENFELVKHVFKDDLALEPNWFDLQIRQSKMEHVANLRQKFEEDKKRIASMKAARRFKPY